MLCYSRAVSGNILMSSLNQFLLPHPAPVKLKGSQPYKTINVAAAVCKISCLVPTLADLLKTCYLFA